MQTITESSYVKVGDVIEATDRFLESPTIYGTVFAIDLLVNGETGEVSTIIYVDHIVGSKIAVRPNGYLIRKVAR